MYLYHIIFVFGHFFSQPTSRETIFVLLYLHGSGLNVMENLQLFFFCKGKMGEFNQFCKMRQSEANIIYSESVAFIDCDNTID